MLQFRPVGDSAWKQTPFYSPARDIAHNGLAFISNALVWLEECLNDEDSGFRRLIESIGVTEDDLIAAAIKLAEFFNKVNTAGSAYDAAKEFGILDHEDLAMQVVQAFIGRYMTLAVFTGLRDLSDIPDSVKEFVMMINEAKKCAKD